MDANVGMRHSFDLTIRMRIAPLEERLLLCNALDGYELEKGLTSTLVLDVMECGEDRVIVRVTPMRSLTYAEIGRYMKDLLEFAGEQTNWRLDLVPIDLKWEHAKYGVPSERFDRSLLIARPHREAILQDIGVQAAAEQAVPAAAPAGQHGLRTGACYLVRTSRSDRAFEVLATMALGGCPALVVTRRKPATVRVQYGLKRTPIIWLTGNEHPDEKCLPPTEIAKLHLVISDFLEKAKGGVVLLDGLEYLITNTSFSTVLKLTQHLADLVMLRDARLIVAVAPEALGDKEIGLLQRDMEALE